MTSETLYILLQASEAGLFPWVKAKSGMYVALYF